ncbi:MAG: alpha-galactosidase [Armatimonadota bacterium]
MAILTPASVAVTYQQGFMWTLSADPYYAAQQDWPDAVNGRGAASGVAVPGPSCDATSIADPANAGKWSGTGNGYPWYYLYDAAGSYQAVKTPLQLVLSSYNNPNYWGYFTNSVGMKGVYKNYNPSGAGYGPLVFGGGDTTKDVWIGFKAPVDGIYGYYFSNVQGSTQEKVYYGSTLLSNGALCQGTQSVRAGEFLYFTIAQNWMYVKNLYVTLDSVGLPTEISGYVTDADTHAPILGAQVVCGPGNNVVTDSSGYYDVTLQPGTYDITAGAYCYVASTQRGVVASGPSVTQDFSLTNVGARELTPQFTTDKIGNLKSQPNGTVISITSPMVITAASTTFTDHTYYIEEPDRATGIKIIPDCGIGSVGLGDRITFTGVMTADPSGEQAVEIASITTWSTGEEVRPLGMSGKVIAATEGLQGSGLLIRISGWVTYAANDGSYIYVDDGSNLRDGSGKTGLRVLLGGLALPATTVPNEGDYVAITGLAGLVKDGLTSLRAIRPRGDGDITSILHTTLSETSKRNRWVTDYLAEESSTRPFSFTYGGQSFSVLLGGWQQSFSTRTIDANRTERTITYTDPSTHLQVRCVAVVYNDFPTVEWTIYFKNTGSVNTTILENIQALNTSMSRSPGDEFLLHHNIGSPCTMNDYQPLETVLGPSQTKRITGAGGRPTNSDLPYFNLETSSSSGMIVVVGWPGQWAAQFTRDASSGLSIVAGQETTHFTLYPGEEVRTPLVVLQFWNGDWVSSQNTWRRWMIAHNVPKPGGQPLTPLIFASDVFCNGNELILYNEAQENVFIDRYIEEGLHPDCWWIDAGWYVNHGTWMNTGTWQVDTARFPNGLRGVTDHAHSHGMKSMVWFEPERATNPSWMNDNHPDWLLGTVGYWQLVYLGNPPAWQWAVDMVDTMMTQEGIDWYRQDFNWDPLTLWQGNDTSDRQGITEIKHVVGYLAFWDELRQRHPDMLIDSCASGGRRNDLETLRRAVPLWRSDYNFNPPGMQCQTYGISMWMPYYGTGVGHPSVSTCDPYSLRSDVAPSVAWMWDVRRTDLDYNLMRSWMAKWREIAPNCLGDYYPLTPYSTATDVWMAWQFDRPEIGEGMVQAFRRPGNTQSTVVFKLRGLDSAAQYTITDIDAGRLEAATGSDLMNQGVAVTINSQPGAAVVTYKKTN